MIIEDQGWIKHVATTLRQIKPPHSPPGLSSNKITTSNQYSILGGQLSVASTGTNDILVRQLLVESTGTNKKINKWYEPKPQPE